MLSTAQADPTPWLPLPDLDDWVDGEPPAGTERANNYYRARYYDPKIGRFISEDPIGFEGGINFYPYVESNPVNLVDPFGLFGCPVLVRVPPIFRPHTFRLHPNQTFNQGARGVRATKPRPYIPVQQPLPPPPPPPPQPWWWELLCKLLEICDPTPPVITPACGQCPTQPPDCPPGMVCIA